MNQAIRAGEGAGKASGVSKFMGSLAKMVGGTWIEHVTPTMSTWCSTAELTAHTISLKRGWVYREAEMIASSRLSAYSHCLCI
jgi:hypothetical protein